MGGVTHLDEWFGEEGPCLDLVGGVTHLDELYGEEGPCLDPVGGLTHLDELHGEEGPVWTLWVELLTWMSCSGRKDPV